MTRIGLIDMGSNTVRLAVFDVDEKATPIAASATAAIPSHAPFEPIFDSKVTLGLSASIKNGVLEEEALQNACPAVLQSAPH